jgi:cyclopropane fatty-acyl-phospholipid synthase-like methyltransferase
MNQNQSRPDLNQPEQYWNQAGELGYVRAMYTSDKVGQHVKGQIWSQVVEAASRLGLNEKSKVLELGCGDGELANHVLAKHFNTVDAYDLSPAGIDRANLHKSPNARFYCEDITQLKFPDQTKYDAVFFVGILHHVKKQTPQILDQISRVTDKVIVMEPNGNHLVRKFLEQTPTYRKAGEDSFRLELIRGLFTDRHFQQVYYRRFNFCPNFTPASIFPILKKAEEFIDRNAALDFLCTNQIFAFEKRRDG